MVAAFYNPFTWPPVVQFLVFCFVWIFGCAGLLLVRERAVDKTSATRFGRALLTTFVFSVVWFFAYIIMSLVGNHLSWKTHFPRPQFICTYVGLVVGLLATWLTIKIMFKQSFKKAFLLWLPVLGLQLLASAPLLLMSEVGIAREPAKRSVCKTQLRSLAIAMDLYHQEYELYPPSPKEFAEGGYASTKNFHCPSDIQDREISFFYLPPLETDSGETFVMCDLHGNHDNVRNALWKRGYVGEFSEEAFQTELAKPHNARFAEALKKAEGL